LVGDGPRPRHRNRYRWRHPKDAGSSACPGCSYPEIIPRMVIRLTAGQNRPFDRVRNPGYNSPSLWKGD
jgi:hypothetical protein